jgi:tetratricopeptide (TPR) repeat protein
MTKSDVLTDWNNFAWDSLVADKITPAAVQAAQPATSLTQNNAGDMLHTLASIYAEIGKVSEARAVLLKAMDADGMEQPTPDFWYVFERIAEQLGEFKTAEADYKKLEKPKDNFQLSTSTYILAQRRLKILSQQAK